MTSAQIAERFALYLATPQITADEHVRRRIIELGEWVMARDRIYLDKCFWIYLRDARMRVPCPPGTSHSANLVWAAFHEACPPSPC